MLHKYTAMNCIHNSFRGEKEINILILALRVYQLESYTRLKNIKKLAGKM